MKIGLVLEGGGMRALYTAGVIDSFLDHNFSVDVVTATSAGVTFGVNLLSKQRGRVLRYNKRYAGDRRYMSLYSLFTTGNIVGTKFAYDALPNRLDPFDEETFEASGTKFYATVTNVETGEAEYILLKNCQTQIDVIRASASLPLVSRKVEIDGKKYLDGGVVDNIPLDRCIEEGCDRIIIVLTRPKGYVKKDNMARLCRFRYPFSRKFVRAAELRNERYNRRLAQIEKLEAEGKVFVLRPDDSFCVGRLEKNPDNLQKMYDMGYADMERNWDALQSYLAKY